MSKVKKKYAELLAITITAALKFLMMDWLQWRGFYISGICLFWLVYVLSQIKSNNKQLELWGFRSQGYRASMLFLSPFIVTGILICLVYAKINDSLYFSWHIIPVLIFYPLWGIIQQFLMLSIILQNLNIFVNIKINRYVIVLIVSALFSLIHYPSFFLMIFTFFLEIIFISAYFKWRNLWAIGIAHGWIATFLLFYVFNRNLWQELFSMN
jgi:hypothetical protein